MKLMKMALRQTLQWKDISDLIFLFAQFSIVLFYIITDIWTMLHEQDPGECSVLMSVHVIYSSTVLFSTQHGLSHRLLPGRWYNLQSRC